MTKPCSARVDDPVMGLPGKWSVTATIRTASASAGRAYVTYTITPDGGAPADETKQELNWAAGDGNPIRQTFYVNVGPNDIVSNPRTDQIDCTPIALNAARETSPKA